MTASYKTLLKIETKYRLALSGTPIQNNLKEYYNMCEWVRPGFLGMKYKGLGGFFELYEKPIKLGSLEGECVNVRGERVCEGLIQLLTPDTTTYWPPRFAWPSLRLARARRHPIREK